MRESNTSKIYLWWEQDRQKVHVLKSFPLNHTIYTCMVGSGINPKPWRWRKGSFRVPLKIQEIITIIHYTELGQVVPCDSDWLKCLCNCSIIYYHNGADIYSHSSTFFGREFKFYPLMKIAHTSSLNPGPPGKCVSTTFPLNRCVFIVFLACLQSLANRWYYPADLHNNM